MERAPARPVLADEPGVPMHHDPRPLVREPAERPPQRRRGVVEQRQHFVGMVGEHHVVRDEALVPVVATDGPDLDGLAVARDAEHPLAAVQLATPRREPLRERDGLR